VPFTITLTGGAGTLIGNITLPASLLLGGGSGSGSITVTGGTGTYAGATGSFPSVTGTGAISPTTGGITLTFTGAGTITNGSGGTTTATPAITAVQDAASNTVKIAQGSIFIVKGNNLSATGYTPFSPPRPTLSSGVKVTFTPTTGGTGTDCYLVYLYNQSGVNQIAAILPSTVAVGNYNVTVTNGTAVSSGFATQVVATKIGLFTQDSSGSGLASLQNYISASTVDLNRLTTGSVSGITISPAKPGQPVIAYGTGLGAYAAGDNATSPAYDYRSTLNILAVVGGVSIPVAYAGLAGYAGEDQINFTLPTNVPTGCAVSLQISVNGVLSPAVAMSIAPDANSSACVFPGLTTQQLQNLDQGGTITSGGFTLESFTETIPQLGTTTIGEAGGSFTQTTGFQLVSYTGGSVTSNTSGSCTVTTATSGTATVTGGTINALDAGAVTLTGPAGSNLTNVALTDTSNTYSLSLSGIAVPGAPTYNLVGGTYSLKGAGGKDVGSFNTSVTIGSPLVVTGGLPSTVVRSSGLPLKWTGGNASDVVEIIGGTSTTAGTTTTSTSFLCYSTAGAGGFTVPSSILTQIPAATTGFLEVASSPASTSFTASLTAGGSVTGYFTGFSGTGAAPAYQ